MDKEQAQKIADITGMFVSVDVGGFVFLSKSQPEYQPLSGTWQTFKDDMYIQGFKIKSPLPFKEQLWKPLVA